jgi:hypothetical protein
VSAAIADQAFRLEVPLHSEILVGSHHGRGLMCCLSGVRR